MQHYAKLGEKVKMFEIFKSHHGKIENVAASFSDLDHGLCLNIVYSWYGNLVNVISPRVSPGTC
jgi:hypothetical protein